MPRVFLILAILSCCGLDAAAREPVPLDAEEVRQLVEDLNSSSRAARLSAEERLIELGEAALAGLADHRAAAVPAVIEALNRIRDRIERDAAGRLFQSSRVTLVPPLTVEEALVQIVEQTGNELRLDQVPLELRRRKLNRNVDALPFWEVLDLVCRETRIGWQWDGGTALSLSPDVPLPAGRAVVTNGLRISVDSQPRRQSFAAPQLRRILRLNGRVDVEPRLQAFFLTVADRDFVLREGDHVWLPFNPDARREFPVLSGQSVTFSLDLKREPEFEAATATLEGRVDLRGAARRVPVSFTAGEDDHLRRIGRTQVELLSRRTTASGETEYTLRVTFERPGPELESHRLGLLHRDAWLERPDGERVPFRELQLLRVDGISHTVRYTFPAERNGDPPMLTYLVPELVTTIAVPFVIEAVPFAAERR